MNFSDMMKLPIADSENFLWEEALWLKNWQTFAIPPHAVEKNIIELARRLTLVREFLAAPLIVTSWYRPPLYNEAIGGATRSQHMLGRACDFIVEGVSADDVRTALYPKLAEFNLRMENLPRSSWVHLDMACTENMPLERRFFSP